MKKVLISAFTPFNNETNNYSGEVLKYIESDKYIIDKVIIDVVYDKCFDELSKRGLDSYDFIIALGEARMRDVLTVERRAKNMSSCSLPDNSGVQKKDEIIDPTLPDVIVSELDLALLTRHADISDDAGKFVCNNMYFHLLKYDSKKTLFIHIPECKNSIDNYKLYADKIESILDILLFTK